MKARYLLLSALVGGLTTFGWGFVSHGTGLFKSLEPNTFREPDVLRAIQENAPVNGVYMDDRGVFAVVDLERGPNPSTRFGSIVVPMLTQLVVDIVVAFLLAWLLWLKADRIWAYAWTHFVDHAHGAWYRILAPDNAKVTDLKSPAGKVDYHDMGACHDVLAALGCGVAWR